MSKATRKMEVAGQFYPNSSIEIQQMIDSNTSKPNNNHKIKALILPHAGYVYSGNTAVKTLSLASDNNYENVFILAPSHYVRFNGAVVSKYDQYETPFGNIEVNKNIVDFLINKGIQVLDKAHANEHSLEVQLPLIKAMMPNVKIVPIVCGYLDNKDLQKTVDALKKYWSNNKNLWVISSDFTHFGRNFNYIPFKTDIKENLKNLDMGAIKQILNLSCKGFSEYMLNTNATICGRVPISILLNLCKATDSINNLSTQLIEYTTSGELSGDYTHCVSYAGIAVYEDNLKSTEKPTEESYYSNEQKKEMLSLARKTIEASLNKTEFKLEKIPEYLQNEQSCFVTLHTANGQLRGCIGNIEAFESLYDNIRHNAQNSAFNDPRFKRLSSTDELNSLNLEISVLTPKEKVNSYQEIILGKHGIILRALGRGAVFLPQVAPEQNWDINTTLTHLSIKAGLPADIWQKNVAKFEVFEAIVFKER